MIVCDLLGAHTGDMVLALPAMEGLKAEGYDVGVRIEAKYYKPVAGCGFANRLDYHGKMFLPYIGNDTHRTTDWLARFYRMGMDVKPRRTKFNLKPATDLLPGGDWVLLQPWCEWPAKHWPIGRWKALADALKLAGHKVAVAGPKVFRDKANEIGVTNICGQDSGRWVDTIAAAGTIVSIDSGAVHVADALEKKVIALYGSAMPVHVWSPYWDDSGVIAKDNILDITVEDVMEKL